ncbi:MAG: 30S ribosomal protein S2 [Planctomycetaceae bacterium]|nr:30S ribosomal protein S2 [Planctomycetaceae bacterium]
MADVTLVKQLIESGIHYGHRTSNWCPKMGTYIYGKRNGIHIIDVRETVKGLLLARKFLTRTVAEGKDILFVGTKRQARPVLLSCCEEVGMPSVTERWLGGTLTNFRTIRARLKRLEELEALEASGEIESYSKKMASHLTREQRKIERNLSGIRAMDRLPGAMVVIDVNREDNALKEARKLGIPSVCLIDTDSDPDQADLPIPGNDDAMRAIELVMRQLTEAVKEGKEARAVKAREAETSEPEAGGARRSARATYRAVEPATRLAEETERAAIEEEKAAAQRTAPLPATEGPAVPVEEIQATDIAGAADTAEAAEATPEGGAAEAPADSAAPTEETDRA